MDNQTVGSHNSSAVTSLEKSIEYLRAGNFQSALETIQSAINSSPKMENASLVAGVACCKLQRHEEGLKHLRCELESFPNNQSAKELLQEIESLVMKSTIPAGESRPHIALLSENPSTGNNGAGSQAAAMALNQAVEAYRLNKGPEALAFAEKAIQSGIDLPEMYWVYTLCLNLVGRHEEALRTVVKELERNPRHGPARAEFERLSAALGHRVPPMPNPEQRSYHSKVPFETLSSIQAAGHQYHYRGVPMIKNPFDLGLYPKLIWDVKPKTIIEIGSKNGGSALWFGDMLNNFGIEGHVYSLDIVRVADVTHPRVTFMQANGRDLGEVLTPEFCAKLPRPWLVIEDADHSYETSSAALKFFHPLLQGGEYIIIEDGVISDLSKDADANSGPHRALKEFFKAVPGEYDVDSSYADFFGYNFTWCTNGFLKKKKYAVNKQIPKHNITEFNTDDPAPLGAESQMSRNERFQLYSAVREIGSQPHPRFRFVEIGSYSGASLKLISAAFARVGRPFDGISVEPSGTPEFYQQLQTLKSNVTHFKMFSAQARDKVAEIISRDGVHPQIMFIDGDHSYEGVKADIVNYYPLLAPGGIMVFHDFLPELNDKNREAIFFHHAGNEPGIRRACVELMENEYKCELLDLPLLYPEDPTQTQPHLPVIPGVFSTVRAYRKR